MATATIIPCSLSAETGTVLYDDGSTEKVGLVTVTADDGSSVEIPLSVEQVGQLASALVALDVTLNMA